MSEPQEATKPGELADEYLDIQGTSNIIKLVKTTNKRTKKRAYLPVLETPTDAPMTARELATLSKLRHFVPIAEEVGIVNFTRALSREVRQAGYDATADSTPADGSEPSDADYWAKFIENWQPSDRRSGTGVKQLREKAAKFYLENVKPLLELELTGRIALEQHTRLLLVWSEHEEMQEKANKGTKPRKAKTA